MKTIKLAGLIMLFFSLIMNSQPIAQSDWNVMVDDDYTISFPDDWDMTASGEMGSSFILYSKLSSGKDKFRENLNLYIQDLQGRPVGLDKYVEITSGQIKNNMKNGHIVESKRLIANKTEFHKMIYTADKGESKFKFDQYCWVKNGSAYVLTLTCETSQFDKYKEIGEKIMNTLMFK